MYLEELEREAIRLRARSGDARRRPASRLAAALASLRAWAAVAARVSRSAVDSRRARG
jgi:hypothetical protein